MGLIIKFIIFGDIFIANNKFSIIRGYVSKSDTKTFCNTWGARWNYSGAHVFEISLYYCLRHMQMQKNTIAIAKINRYKQKIAANDTTDAPGDQAPITIHSLLADKAGFWNSKYKICIKFFLWLPVIVSESMQTTNPKCTNNRNRLFCCCLCPKDFSFSQIIVTFQINLRLNVITDQYQGIKFSHTTETYCSWSKTNSMLSQIKSLEY